MYVLNMANLLDYPMPNWRSKLPESYLVRLPQKAWLFYKHSTLKNVICRGLMGNRKLVGILNEVVRICFQTKNGIQN